LDRLSVEARSAHMRKIRSKDTRPEFIVRRLLHRLGYRYRLHRGDLPGKPDLVFGSRRKVIQVHGCFWHQHDGCRHSHIPKSRLDYWVPKLARTVERDRSSLGALEAAGWCVMIVWECEVRDGAKLEKTLTRFLGAVGNGRPVAAEPRSRSNRHAAGL
jgi:DNA mismatch endonuclease (patch repair protein)